jgi:hypothetical protein
MNVCTLQTGMWDLDSHKRSTIYNVLYTCFMANYRSFALYNIGCSGDLFCMHNCLTTRTVNKKIYCGVYEKREGRALFSRQIGVRSNLLVSRTDAIVHLLTISTLLRSSPMTFVWRKKKRFYNFKETSLQCRYR